MNMVLPDIHKSAQALEKLEVIKEQEIRNNSASKPSLQKLSKDKLKSLLKSGSISVAKDIKISKKILEKKGVMIKEEMKNNKLTLALKNGTLYYGYIYTFRCANKNKLKKWFFLLKKDKMIFYNDAKLVKSLGVINLHKCYIKPDTSINKVEESVYFGIHLYHNIGFETLYCDDKDEHNKWLQTFQSILKEQDSISNYFLTVSLILLTKIKIYNNIPI